MPRTNAAAEVVGAACCGKAVSTTSTRGAATRKQKTFAKRLRGQCILMPAPFTQSEIASRGANSWPPENWQKFLPREQPTSEQTVRDLLPKFAPRAFSRLDTHPASARVGPLCAAVARVGDALFVSSAAYLCLKRRQEPAHGGSLSKGLPP